MSLRFISGKPLIDANSVPRFEFSDGSAVRGFEDLRAKIPQFETIPSTAVGVQLESELADIRDISTLIDILQTTANTVSIVGGDSRDSLSKKILLLKTAATVGKGKTVKNWLPKSLDHFQLGHIEPLMVKLRFVRAKRMVINNHLPFHKSDKTFFKEVPEKLLPSIDDMLHHVQPGEPTANLGPTIEIVVFSYRDHDAAQITSADKVLTFLLH